MFDRCRHWRHKLTLYTDGLLPESQITALELHIAHCASCHAASEADTTLHEVLRLHGGLPNPIEALAFDERVIKRLRIGLPASREAVWLARLRSSVPFLNQMMGGALFSAALAGLCLFVNLHSTVKRQTSQVEVSPAHLVASPSVPLSSLLQTPTPRAAMLWSSPERTDKAANLGKQKLKRSGSPHSAHDDPARIIS